MKKLLRGLYHGFLRRLQSVKTFLNCLRSGIGYDSSWVVKGKPVLRVAGRPRLRYLNLRGRLSIGKKFLCFNKFDSNSIGLIQPCFFHIVNKDKSIRIGDNVGISGSTLCAADDIVIGSNVLIGSGCLISTTDSHPVHWEARRLEAGPAACAPVVIEDDVFIGARCIILKGVTIGQGAVIGAGSVVTKSIPPRVVAAGNPARVIREIGE